MKTWFLRGLFAATLALAGAVQAQSIDASATGNWYIPAQAGHGLQIEVLDLSRAVVAWYTFDLDGNPVWLFGMGTIEGDTLRAELRTYEGARFPPNFDSDNIEDRVWGDIVFRRTGCNSATLAYTPAEGNYQPAEFPLERLTKIDGSHCRSEPAWSQQRSWNPTQASPGFESLFLDYPDGREDFYELSSGPTTLPEPWQDLSGVRISGSNHSDDLMMVLMRPVDGLAPETRYAIELEMQFATNVPEGCAGVGGSPGESVYMRLGAAGEKPDYEVADGDRRATIDLGQQASPGKRAISVGDMANGADESYCSSAEAPWRLKRVSTRDQEFSVTSNATGRIWVYGLSDSGFEATTSWYLTEFAVRFAKAEP